MPDARPSVSEREKEVLEYWEKNDIFKKTVEKDAPRGAFVFYEGPPTANGKPGIHHVEARAFKDLIPRFRTMQGYRVARKGGWASPGLPGGLGGGRSSGLRARHKSRSSGSRRSTRSARRACGPISRTGRSSRAGLGFGWTSTMRMSPTSRNMWRGSGA